MARKKKENGEAAPKTNGTPGPTPQQIESIVNRLENLYGQIETRMAEARNDCRSIHQDAKDVYTEAKDTLGLSKKALASVLKARKLERKAAKARDELDQEHQDEHDRIRHALGDLADTPLGRSALGDDADLRPRFKRDEHAAEG